MNVGAVKDTVLLSAYSKGGDPFHMEDIFYFENVADRYEEVNTADGDYVWNGSSWRYRGQ